jgi:thiol-disulfide isomerase/thioredoxin
MQGSCKMKSSGPLKWTAIEAPYEEKADAKAELEAAFARARKNSKSVLLNLGGNWCPDARALAGMLEISQLHDWLDDNYEYVKINIGDYDRNMDIPARFGFEELEGVPALLVVKADGLLVNEKDCYEFRNARERRPQEILDYLIAWRERAKK